MGYVYKLFNLYLRIGVVEEDIMYVNELLDINSKILMWRLK